MSDPYRIAARPDEDTVPQRPSTERRPDQATVALWITTVILVVINGTLSLSGYHLVAVFPGVGAITCVGILLVRHLSGKRP